MRRVDALRPVQHEQVGRHLLGDHDVDLLPRRLVAGRKGEWSSAIGMTLSDTQIPGLTSATEQRAGKECADE